ncbi:unnamed protein product [Porites evermanni]|uniref:PLAT domain-containing protein n=1 Tax=Porites evermanni TaxID=104178 RepID=A0ABN8RF57_9CNID|nr:unnamed protein product [Porites evermanni]
MRRNAGTKSKVNMIVYGDEHDSEPRSLEYPHRSPFQRGSQDTFLLTTPFSMGTIQYIRIWHDNAGGSWFLSRIMVIDLQTDERYYFICNRWLAVDEEDGQVERLVPLASKEELTEFGHLFVARTRRNLSDSHLWFSVLARPANSRFTRVQRLSCCLCLLLMSMMASGMYYERENDSANVQHVGQFVFTWEQVLIGIISSLIVFPINLIVVQIFRNVRPKPKVKPKKPPPQLPSLSFTKDNIENYNHLKESSDESTKGSNNSLDSSRERNNRTRLSINDVHTDVDRASFTDSPLLIDRRLSTAYEIAPTSRWRRAVLFFKKRNSLPYQAVYLAWFLVFAFSTGSAVVVVLYGMQFENVKSLQWLFSSVVSFVQDILITQPLKVLGLAVFFALVVKKPDQGEFQITEEALKLAEDEEFLQQSNQTGEKTNKAKLLPPDQAKLIAMRTARMKERKMYSVIREVVTYYFFVALLLTIAYTHRSPTAFYQTTNMVNMIGASFTKITNQREFWNWTQNDLLDSLFPGTWYNGAERKRDGYMADGYSQMVGGARMRLLRIKQESCQVPSEVYGITNECYGEYYITGDDKNDYTPGWNITKYATRISWDDMPWRYQNSTQLGGYPFWAKLTTYGGAGRDCGKESCIERAVHKSGLTCTRPLTISRPSISTVYSSSTKIDACNALSNIACVAGACKEGASSPPACLPRVRPFFLSPTTSKRLLRRLLATPTQLSSLKRPFRSYPKPLFQSEADCEAIVQCFILGQIKLIFTAHSATRFYTPDFRSCTIPRVPNLSPYKLRLNKHFSDVFPYALVVRCTYLPRSFSDFLCDLRRVMFIGTSPPFCHLVPRSIFTEMRDTNRILGPLFFFGFMFMMSFVLINMFLSIVVDSFLVVKHDNDKQSNEYEIVDFIIERFKLWSGIGKTRRPHSRRRVLWDTAACRVKAINAFRDREHSVTIAGLHKDMVSELENRLEKLVVRTDVLYDELFPEKRRSKITGKQGAVKVKLPLSKADLLQGRTG